MTSSLADKYLDTSPLNLERSRFLTRITGVSYTLVVILEEFHFIHLCCYEDAGPT